MDADTFASLLTELRACDEAKVFASGKSLQEAWDRCENPSWLFWLGFRVCRRPGWVDDKALILAACDCAETAFPFVTDPLHRPQKCVEVTRRYVAGNATRDELLEARSAAYAATDAAYAAAAATAYAAADAAADAADAAAADAATADAAAYAAAYAAAARKDANRKLCDLIRKRIPVPFTPVIS
jgi:hypothetical protein